MHATFLNRKVRRKEKTWRSQANSKYGNVTLKEILKEQGVRT